MVINYLDIKRIGSLPYLYRPPSLSLGVVQGGEAKVIDPAVVQRKPPLLPLAHHGTGRHYGIHHIRYISSIIFRIVGS